MNFRIAFVSLWVAATTTLAQPPFQTYGQVVEERASTRLAFDDGSNTRGTLAPIRQ